MIIRIQNLDRGSRVALKKVERALRRILRDLKLPKSEISVTFAGVARMASLNRRYLGRAGVTDVISFPAAPMPGRLPHGRVLGDIVIHVPKIRSQAKKAGRLPREELAHVLIHGVLHLLGYDHDTAPKARRMRRKELQLLEAAARHLR